jgi:hypothetical protein
MKLSYRGSSYEVNPQSVEMIESDISARYRGLNYQVRRPVNSLTMEPMTQYRFRGIPYSKA